jgi:hypothetical protein
MQIPVKMLTGQHLSFKVAPTDRIEDVKVTIQDKEAIRPDEER